METRNYTDNGRKNIMKLREVMMVMNESKNMANGTRVKVIKLVDEDEGSTVQIGDVGTIQGVICYRHGNLVRDKLDNKDFSLATCRDNLNNDGTYDFYEDQLIQID